MAMMKKEDTPKKKTTTKTTTTKVYKVKGKTANQFLKDATGNDSTIAGRSFMYTKSGSMVPTKKKGGSVKRKK